MHKPKLLLAAAITATALQIAGCASTGGDIMKSTSVPEEGGIRFTKLTLDNENIAGPFVGEADGVMQWWAPPLIAITEDGKKLAYLAEMNDNINIFIRNTESGKATVQRTFRNSVNDMTFSPDGNWVAFCDNREGERNIYMINSKEGSAIQQITSSTGSIETGPCFTPDGKKIFFAKEEKDVNESGVAVSRYYIWSFNRETSLMTQHCEGFAPSIDADGEKIAMTRINKKTGRGEIWMLDLKSDQESLILSSDKVGYSTPQFSPDGKQLLVVFTSLKRKGSPANLDIGTVKVDGTNFTQLTFHPGRDASARWAPDGKQIYFLSTRGNTQKKYNVWMMTYKNA